MIKNKIIHPKEVYEALKNNERIFGLKDSIKYYENELKKNSKTLKKNSKMLIFLKKRLKERQRDKLIFEKRLNTIQTK